MSDNNISNSLKWWDKKRIWYNIIVGSASITYLIHVNPETFNLADLIGVIIYAFGANLLYTLGFLLELYDMTYMKSSIGFHRFRLISFIFGTVFSVLYSLYQIDLYYYYNPLIEG